MLLQYPVLFQTHHSTYRRKDSDQTTMGIEGLFNERETEDLSTNQKAHTDDLSAKSIFICSWRREQQALLFVITWSQPGRRMTSAEDTDPQKIGCEFMFKLANSSRHFIRSSEKEFVSLNCGRTTIFSKLSPVPPESAMLRFHFRTWGGAEDWATLDLTKFTNPQPPPIRPSSVLSTKAHAIAYASIYGWDGDSLSKAIII